jgi:SAM-dependent methyltransferase
MKKSTDWMRPPSEDRPLPEVDLSRPSVARVYDYVLGGKDNFAVDRAACEGFLRLVPEARQVALDNRAVLRRAVRYLVAEAGISQILDIGSGLPTVGNVHEVAHAVDPAVRVVYVDRDPIVLAHGRALLADNNNTTVITADLLEQDSIFDHPVTRHYIDFAEPYAILASGILHHLSDEQDPVGVTAGLRERLPSGGYLFATNFFDNGDPRARLIEESLQEAGVTPGRFRTYAEQIRYYDGLELVEPGLVRANDWRPDADTMVDSPTYDLYAAGLGRKP